MAEGGRNVNLQRFARYSLFIFVCFMSVLPQTRCEKRTITIKTHNCLHISECNDKSYQIYQVIAVGRNDTIQYLWSTVGVPSIVVAYFNKVINQQSANLNINWKELFSYKPGNAIQFEPAQDYISSVAFTSIYEFTDPKNKVFLDESPKAPVRHGLDKVIWSKPSLREDTVLFRGTFLNGSVTFKCTAAAEEDRDKQLPHQRYNQNMTRFWLSLDNFSSDMLSTKSTRLAIEIQSLTEHYSHRKTKTCLQAEKSIDDEYTPSIFKTVFLSITTSSEDRSFISWKPVGYGEDFTFKDQTLMYEYVNGKHVSPSHKCDELMTQLTNNMTKGVAGAVMNSKVVVKGMNVSFGEANDGYYQKNHYLTWCGQVGYGKPLVDSISTVAVIIIVTCLGVPFLLILLGSIYLCVRKYKEQQTVSKYGIIN